MECDAEGGKPEQLGLAKTGCAAWSAYAREIACTDRLPVDDVEPVTFGLFGEVGSVLSVMKKRVREDSKTRSWRRMFVEELADVLWYFAAVCRRLGVDPSRLGVFETATGCVGSLSKDWSVRGCGEDRLGDSEASVKLGEAAAGLLRVRVLDEAGWSALQAFANCYIRVVVTSRLALEDIIQVGKRKAYDGFVLPPDSALPRFDVGFPECERLPERFEIRFTERADGRCEMLWEGAAVGDPLDDAIVDADDFRFHDVFHLAHVAVLHWSPTFRALAGRKRKSVPEVDGTEDGSRARVVEEAIVSWIFGRAVETDFFDGHQCVAFDLLKTIAQFVRGFEVERCPLRLWEKAILTGYEVFRQVQANGGGTVIGSRGERTLVYAGRG